MSNGLIAKDFTKKKRSLYQNFLPVVKSVGKPAWALAGYLRKRRTR
jgi:hypothetical protein